MRIDSSRSLLWPGEKETMLPIPGSLTRPHPDSTLRKLNAEGKKVFYTGAMGDLVPVVKG